MNLAVITLYCNERFRAADWIRYYAEYAQAVSLHVIVNNGDSSETEFLKNSFPGSLVLESPVPNMMASYNLALREILRRREIDTIAQIVNDIRISAADLSVLYSFLYADPHRAMVSPVLLEKDSDRIDCFGCEIERRGLDFIHRSNGLPFSVVDGREETVTGLPAGIVMARRNIYEQIGFQDEALFMYSDEIDMGLRAADAGYTLAVSAFARAWHQHIYPTGKVVRSPRAAYLMGRNPVYIARKRGDISVLRVFFHRVYVGLREMGSAIRHRKSFDCIRFGWQQVKGAFAGLWMRLPAPRNV